MSTTALIVEILIIGVLSSVWAILILLSIFGLEPGISLWIAAKESETLASIAFISISYSLGVIVDRLADMLYLLLQPTRFILRWRWINDKVESAHKDVRMQIMVREKRATDFLENVRNRMRVTRAISLNMALITLAFLAMCVSVGYYEPAVELAAVGVGVSCSLVSFMCAAVLDVTYQYRLKQARKALDEEMSAID